MSWHRHAACVDHPAEWWGTDSATLTRKAVTVCLHCPVRRECLADAVEAGETYGVRGGRVFHKVKGSVMA